MGWIADVAPQTTIRSVWGNSVRDCVVHQFVDLAEANAHALPNGTHAAIAGVPYIRRGGAWVLMIPAFAQGTVVSGSTGNIEKNWASMVLPAGYAIALIVAAVTFSGNSGDLIYTRLRDAANAQICGYNDAISTAGWCTHGFTWAGAWPNGTTIHATYATDFQHTITAYTNASLSAILFP